MGGAQVHVSEVDGVRVVWAQRPGPARGGLVVRGGTADETLLTAGLVHLVEHLALAGVGAADRSRCGTGRTLTRFRFAGTPDDVRAAVSTVAARLSDLPTGRIAAERAVLADERAARGDRGEERLLRARYGVVGYGSAAATSEYGLDRLTADDASLHARRVGVRDGCAVWLTVPPDGLALRLRPGSVPPPPDPRPGFGGVPRTAPGWVRTPTGTGGVLGVVDRTQMNAVLVEVLRKRLERKLSAVLGDDDDPRPVARVVVDPVTADAALVLLGVVNERFRLGWTPWVTRVLEATASGVSDAEVDEARRLLGRGVRDVEDVAADLVLGVPEDRAVAGTSWPSAAPGAPGLDAVTPDDVASAAAGFLDGALAAFDRTGEGSRTWRREPDVRYAPVDGRRFISRDAPTETRELVAGPDGVTLDRPREPHLTVPVAATAVVVRWPDGRRQLVGTDGTVVVVEPTLWVDGRRLVEHIDRTWPAALVVERPARPPHEIPQPDYGTDGRNVPLVADRTSTRGRGWLQALKAR